jgi:DivIVA domain-containing protein
VGARAISLVTDQPEPGHFSLSWRGYDRAEVDAFMERTAADRQRLQDDLAQLEAAMAGQDLERQQELERLAGLRVELARCLETSINALHVANLILVSPGINAKVASRAPVPAVHPVAPSREPDQLTWPLPAWLSPGRTLTLVGVISAAVVILSGLSGGSRSADNGLEAATLTGPGPSSSAAALSVASPAPLDLSVLLAASAPVRMAAPPRPAIRPAVEPEPVAALPTVATPAAEPAWGVGATPAPPTHSLVLTLTAVNECWIRSTIDGGEPSDRLLKANESITLRAGEEAILRIGDPAALHMQINGRPARTLGTAGRVVTARITASNYLDFLSGN